MINKFSIPVRRQFLSGDLPAVTERSKPVQTLLLLLQLVFDRRQFDNFDLSFREIDGTIQCGFRKWGIHARVFSQTLAHGNSKDEIRKRN